MSGKEKGFVIIVLAICVFACCYIFYKPQPQKWEPHREDLAAIVGQPKKITPNPHYAADLEKSLLLAGLDAHVQQWFDNGDQVLCISVPILDYSRPFVARLLANETLEDDAPKMFDRIVLGATHDHGIGPDCWDLHPPAKEEPIATFAYTGGEWTRMAGGSWTPQ
jgi:hypothetical protein